MKRWRRKRESTAYHEVGHAVTYERRTERAA